VRGGSVEYPDTGFARGISVLVLGCGEIDSAECEALSG